MKDMSFDRQIRLDVLRGFNVFFLSLIVFCKPCYAHRPSDSFFTLKWENGELSGQIELAIKDLEMLMALDSDHDMKVTWGELKSHKEEIFQYINEKITFQSNKKNCSLTHFDLLVTNYSDGAYATVPFNVDCFESQIVTYDLTYNILFELDAQHRGLLNVMSGSNFQTSVFTSQNRMYHGQSLDIGFWRQLYTFILEGMHHIYRGYDHILFLIALLLPAVYLKKNRKYSPQDSIKAVMVETVKVVTAFTIAHTLSLCVTSFQLIPTPPSRVVESLVAATILLTAITNIFPLDWENRWSTGLCFGFIHGIGYASVLTDLGISRWRLVTPLLGFNLGVEFAQTLIILLFIPIAFLLRHTFYYRKVILLGGSFITAILSCIWMVEQMFKISVISP
jgi:HupE / UreJ protein